MHLPRECDICTWVIADAGVVAHLAYTDEGTTITRCYWQRINDVPSRASFNSTVGHKLFPGRTTAVRLALNQEIEVRVFAGEHIEWTGSSMVRAALL